MKKILSTVAALGLVAGVATTASALEFSVSGHYFIEGVHQSSGDGGGVVASSEDGEDEASNDSFWRHEFKIKPTMKVNDKITVKSTIYLANQGQNTAGGSDGAWGGADLTTANGGNIDVQHIYMEYMSPVGKIRVGRTGSGLWMGDFLSNDQHANRLMYFPNFMPKNWGSVVFLQKAAETDSATLADGTSDTDADYDVYEATVWYKTKDMIVHLGYDYYRDARDEEELMTKHRIKGYYNQNFSDMYAELEFQYDFGEVDDDNVLAPDEDIDTFGLMADVGMKMDKLDVGMMFIYASGTDHDEDDDNNSVGQLGEQFQPYNILTGATTGMMVSDFHAADGDMTEVGIISLGIHADYAVSDKLSLNTAVVYAEAEADLEPGVDEEYGWEVDLGMSYSLMDNLTYQVDFGYLFAGDIFEGDAASTDDAEDVYTLTHRLTMEF